MRSDGARDGGALCGSRITICQVAAMEMGKASRAMRGAFPAFGEPSAPTGEPWRLMPAVLRSGRSSAYSRH